MKSFPDKVGAVIPAAGAGLRFGGRKQFEILGRRPLLYHSLLTFVKTDLIAEIVVVVPGDSVKQVEREVLSITGNRLVKVTAGGKHRQDSVFAGVKALSEDCALVCVHDAARPFVTTQMIHNCITVCGENDGAIIAVPARDTIKRTDADRKIIRETLDRSVIWQAQTPQVFYREKLILALETANRDNITGTDEAALLERLGFSVVVVPGSVTNIKVTAPEDWLLAETFWRKSHD